MLNKPPLRYRISNWNQLSNCLSNNSKLLRAGARVFRNNPDICGTLIYVEMPSFGTLFACLVRGSGHFISKDSTGVVPELSIPDILSELAKFGFLVEYDPILDLSGDQIEYLMTVNKLHFDKIRLLDVLDIKNGSTISTRYVVVFKETSLPNWLNSSYCPNRREFTSAIEQGDAMNISAISETCSYTWDWLYNSVENINDIIHQYIHDNPSEG